MKEEIIEKEIVSWKLAKLIDRLKADGFTPEEIVAFLERMSSNEETTYKNEMTMLRECLTNNDGSEMENLDWIGFIVRE